jgi:hypothetical protein
MNISEGPVIVRMADGVVEPVIVAILAHLEDNDLGLHVFDYVPD